MITIKCRTLLFIFLSINRKLYFIDIHINALTQNIFLVLLKITFEIR